MQCKGKKSQENLNARSVSSRNYWLVPQSLVLNQQPPKQKTGSKEVTALRCRLSFARFRGIKDKVIQRRKNTSALGSINIKFYMFSSLDFLILKSEATECELFKTLHLNAIRSRIFRLLVMVAFCGLSQSCCCWWSGKRCLNSDLQIDVCKHIFQLSLLEIENCQARTESSFFQPA